MKISGKELGLDSLGITELNEVHRNLSIDELIEETVINNEGIIVDTFASFTNPMSKKVVLKIEKILN